MSTTQPEALRLAADLSSIFISEEIHATKARKIAAELSRLCQSEREGWRYANELEQERKRLHAEIADLRARVQELGQMARDVNSRRVVEMEAQLASIKAANAGSEAVANNRPSLESVFRGLSDRAYCNYIEQMRRDVCLGWEHKAGHGKFGEAELKGHTMAGEQLGRHKAFAEAANALRGSDAPLTHPSPPEGMVGGWMPIETAPVAGLILLVVEDSAGERRVFPAEASHENGVLVWQVTLGWLGWTRLHSGWTPILWRRIPTPPTTPAGSGKGE